MCVCVCLLKGTFFPSNLRALVYVNNVSVNITYISICSQCASYILESSSSFPSPFTTDISYPFHISLKPPFATQFSHHILSNVFNLSFCIAAVFHNRQFCVFSIMSHMNYWYMYRITNINTTAILKRPHSCYVKCQHAMWTYKPQSTVGQVMSNWHCTIRYNFTNH